MCCSARSSWSRAFPAPRFPTWPTVAPALFPEMKRRGHSPREMIALLATGAAMADTVPPSIVLIVLGAAAGVSIAGLFTSGIVVAAVLLLALAILARWNSRHED